MLLVDHGGSNSNDVRGINNFANNLRDAGANVTMKTYESVGAFEKGANSLGTYDDVLVFAHGSNENGGVMIMGGGDEFGMSHNSDLFKRYTSALDSLVADEGSARFYACRLGATTSSGSSFLQDTYNQMGGRVGVHGFNDYVKVGFYNSQTQVAVSANKDVWNWSYLESTPSGGYQWNRFGR